MKREVLKKIIEYNLFKIRKSNSRLQELTRKYENFEEIKIDENDWLPKVEGLEHEFEILKNEIKEFLQTEEKMKELFKSYKCDHQIRISDDDYRFNSSCERCVLCGYKFFNNSYKHKKDDIAIFKGKEIVNYYDEEYQIHYTIYQILEILLNICKSSNEEEIDIIKELNKIKLNYCDIIRNKNKKFVLFIIGSNKEKIDNYTYFSSDNDIYYKLFINKFRELFNVHITIIGNEDELKEYKEDNLIELLSYESIDDLEKLLKNNADKFDLIVDMSSLRKIKVINNSLKIERYKIDYTNYFPNTKVIKINDLSKDNRSKVIEFLKENDQEFVYNRMINSSFDFYRYDENNHAEDNSKLKGYLDDNLFTETKKLLFK